MKAVHAIIALSCWCEFSVAQNLVRNPGLENYVTCPGFGQFSNTYINDWDKPTYGSTDYYHNNCAGIIPTQQVPHSGDAYAGIIGYNFGQEYREYMTGTLSAPLIPGATYYCEFYVSLNDGYIQAIKELGAFFSASPPGPYANALHVPVTPQIVNSAILLADTSSWMRISGYFLAAGGEQYITIGNFYNDTNTTIVQVGSVGSYGSYYFVDDVWVSLSEGTGVREAGNEEIELYPNPVKSKLTIGHKNSAINAVSVYNIIGKKISSFELNKDETIAYTDIDCSNLEAGIYVVEIKSGEKVFRKKFTRE